MRKPNFSRRVAVTGLGIVSPVGSDIPTAWSNLVAGNSGLREITYWDPTATDCHAAGEVHDLDPNVWMDFKAVRRTDKNVVFAVAAAKQAVEQAELTIDGSNAEEVGVILGSGVGGIGSFSEQFDVMRDRGANRVSPFLVPMYIIDMLSGMVSILLGAKGINYSIVSACATSADWNSILSSLETPSTSSATGLPNVSVISSLVTEVSSVTSCSSAAINVWPSRCQSARISATASGCEMYGSPDWRTCPACAASEKRYASARRATSFGFR